MKLEHLFDLIESDEFRTDANLATDYRMFIRCLLNSEPERSLVAELASPTAKARVLERVKRLCGVATDVRYEHPWDVAISAYLIALSRAAPSIAMIAAVTASRCNQTWWTRHVIQDMSTVSVISPPSSATKAVGERRPTRTTSSKTNVISFDPFAEPRIRSVASVDRPERDRQIRSIPA